jgi:drug/metabolite transporter (DMT)-like permease
MRGSDWLLLWTLSLLWGGSFLFNELALAGLPALTVVWGRVGLAALILWGVVRATGAELPPRAMWPALLVMGLLNNAVPFTLFVLAQGQITGALASVLNAMTPIFTVLVAHFATSDEKLTPARGIGVALGFAGVLAMVLDGGMSGTRLALLACLGAAFSYALASVWGRRFRAAGLAPLATAFGQVTASSALMLPVWLAVDRPWALDWPGWEPVLAVVGLASLSYLLPHSGAGGGDGGVAGDVPDPDLGGGSGLAGLGRAAGGAAVPGAGADPCRAGGDRRAAFPAALTGRRRGRRMAGCSPRRSWRRRFTPATWGPRRLSMAVCWACR